MENKGYNGLTNYETWNANLWLTNDEGSQELLAEYALEALDHAFDAGCEGEKLVEAAKLELADSIEFLIKDSMPELGSNMFADLLSAAVSEISFYELAEYHIDEQLADFLAEKAADAACDHDFALQDDEGAVCDSVGDPLPEAVETEEGVK